MSEKKIQMNINDGSEFFAHEMSVNFSPTQFILDFRCITPRTDPRTRENALLSLKHNVVMVEPWHAKKILEVLQNMVGEYEKQFGKIDLPKAIKKQQKNMQKIESKDTKESTPSYFG